MTEPRRSKVEPENNYGFLISILVMVMDVAAGVLGIEAEIAQNKVHYKKENTIFQKNFLIHKKLCQNTIERKSAYKLFDVLSLNLHGSSKHFNEILTNRLILKRSSLNKTGEAFEDVGI